MNNTIKPASAAKLAKEHITDAIAILEAHAALIDEHGMSASDLIRHLKQCRTAAHMIAHGLR